MPHNAVSMESLLMTLRDYKPKRLVVVFIAAGTGPGTDVIRWENWRKACGSLYYYGRQFPFEKTSDILADIKTGLFKDRGKIHRDSRSARRQLNTARQHAQDGDIIAIIGKGHEDYQEIEGVRHPFLDRTVVQEAVQKLGM